MTDVDRKHRGQPVVAWRRSLLQLEAEAPRLEAEFLAHLADRLGRPTPAQLPPREVIGVADMQVPAGAADIGAQASPDEPAMHWRALADQFLTELAAVGGHGRVLNREQVCAELTALLQSLGVKSVVAAQAPEWTGWGVQDAVLAAGASWAEPPQCEAAVADGGDARPAARAQWRAQLATADLGITSADFAIAATGTIALFARRETPRAVSLLPPCHLAIVPGERLVASMTEVLLAATGERPTGIHFVTGPSRTSDIEMDSTIGVHGPKEVTVWLVAP